MKRYMLLLLIIALPASIHAAEGGLSNYVPAFYGDKAKKGTVKKFKIEI